jgi:very-short-patch-repair endonuclease
MEGTYFRRQVALGPYFADFCCFAKRLIIELDGAQHGQAAMLIVDAKRTRFLEEHGYRVLRFWNYQVHNEIDGVLDTIMAALSDPHP